MNSLPHVDSVHVTSLGHADERGWNGKGIISGNASRNWESPNHTEATPSLITLTKSMICNQTDSKIVSRLLLAFLSVAQMGFFVVPSLL